MSLKQLHINCDCYCTTLTRSKRFKLVFYKRQKELEAKNIEEEVNERIEELVAKRVATSSSILLLTDRYCIAFFTDSKKK